MELREVAAKWWTPDKSIVSKLPKGGNKDKATWQSCSVCGGWHARNAIHLDYVGHSDLTRALIEIDPEWQWEPVAFDEEGLPRVTQRGGMLVLWGRLTLLGKTMLAVGTCEVTKADADKELVGDMLRNGGMRFGIFGALWSKTDGWHDDDTAGVDGGVGSNTYGGEPPDRTSGVAGSERIVGTAGPSTAMSASDYSYDLSKSPAVLAGENPPEKPLAAMTAGEMARYGESIGVRVSGSKADILRTLEPIVKAASGEEPFEVTTNAPVSEGAAGDVPSEPNAIPFQPVVASAADDSGTARRQRNAIAKGGDDA